MEFLFIASFLPIESPTGTIYWLSSIINVYPRVTNVRNNNYHLLNHVMQPTPYQLEDERN